MVKSKQNLIIESLLFLLMVIFPFGQLLSFRFYLLGMEIPLHPIDLISFLFLVSIIIFKQEKPKIFKYLNDFFLIALASQLIFVVLNGFNPALKGILYLLRLVSYTAIFIAVWNLVRNNKSTKRRIFTYLLGISIFIAFFGWYQYFRYPDLTALKFLGWDDHLYRLVGSFLDPTFTSILLVFGILGTFEWYQVTKKKKFILVLALLISSLLFTYSRAGYLALFAGLFTLLAIRKRLRVSLLFVPLVITGIILLPKPASEGTNLERTASINARLVNYIDTIKIITKSPLIGVGYNNLCWAKVNYLSQTNVDSHACSGSDLSLLLVLATTGILGFILFLNIIIKEIFLVEVDTFGAVFLSCLAALFIHSLFGNSLFYPWVMVFIAILGALSQKET